MVCLCVENKSDQFGQFGKHYWTISSLIVHMYIVLRWLDSLVVIINNCLDYFCLFVCCQIRRDWSFMRTSSKAELKNDQRVYILIEFAVVFSFNQIYRSIIIIIFLALIFRIARLTHVCIVCNNSDMQIIAKELNCFTLYANNINK